MGRNKRASPAIVFSAGKEGQGLVEYALILVLVAVVVIAILLMLGPTVGNVFSEVTVALLHAGGDSPIAGVSVTHPGESVHVFVTVSRNTTVTVALPGYSSKTETFNGTYEFVFGGVAGTGSGTVTAEGYSRSFSY